MCRLNIAGMPLTRSNADIIVSVISSLRLRFRSRLILLISIFLPPFFIRTAVLPCGRCCPCDALFDVWFWQFIKFSVYEVVSTQYY